MTTPPSVLPVFGPRSQIITLDEAGDMFIWEVDVDGNLTARSVPNIPVEE